VRRAEDGVDLDPLGDELGDRERRLGVGDAGQDEATPSGRPARGRFAEGEKNGAAWLIALSLGLRRAAVLALRWADLDLEDGLLTSGGRWRG
jgi:integrase